MKLDPHIHSKYSGDGKNSPLEILKQAKKIGLDYIAISDHNTIKGSQIAIKEAKKLKDIEVISSIEISSKTGHILGFGVAEDIEKGLPADETIEKIHDLGGIAIIPHPLTRYRHGILIKEKIENLKVDAMEVLNARYILGYSNAKSKKIAIKRNIPMIGSSDSHFIESIGDCYTEIDCDSAEDVIKAIKKGKTIAKGKKTSNRLIAREFVNKKIKRIY
ncbi:PHP domain-containing protein [Methanobrevibacter filiformis]|uniref:PHP domain protein n=1 Tax=Methanobrevibacter filiformis TaxID=55758 RepID=A0A166AYK2_9EURY|nr:PHP domain-containing protein [Methanobrevibacter filiformis]KZX12634.1 PHP domain protein [Methanobrevibacter filiformis]